MKLCKIKLKVVFLLNKNKIKDLKQKLNKAFSTLIKIKETHLKVIGATLWRLTFAILKETLKFNKSSTKGRDRFTKLHHTTEGSIVSVTCKLKTFKKKNLDKTVNNPTSLPRAQFLRILSRSKALKII